MCVRALDSSASIQSTSTARKLWLRDEGSPPRRWGGSDWTSHFRWFQGCCPALQINGMFSLLCVFLRAGCWEPLLLRDQRCPHCCWSQCLGGGKNLSRDHRSTNVLLWLWTENLWLPVREWCSCFTLELLHECVVFKHTYVYSAGIGCRNAHVESWVKFSRNCYYRNVKYDLFRIRCILGSGTGMSSFEVASESSWSRRTATSVRTSSPLVSSSLSLSPPPSDTTAFLLIK